MEVDSIINSFIRNDKFVTRISSNTIVLHKYSCRLCGDVCKYIYVVSTVIILLIKSMIFEIIWQHIYLTEYTRPANTFQTIMFRTYFIESLWV